jgi:hypothetical protein
MLTGRTLYSLPRRDPVYEAIVEDRLHPELMRFHAKFESLSLEGIGQFYYSLVLTNVVVLYVLKHCCILVALRPSGPDLTTRLHFDAQYTPSNTIYAQVLL